MMSLHHQLIWEVNTSARSSMLNCLLLSSRRSYRTYRRGVDETGDVGVAAGIQVVPPNMLVSDDPKRWYVS